MRDGDKPCGTPMALCPSRIHLNILPGRALSRCFMRTESLNMCMHAGSMFMDESFMGLLEQQKMLHAASQGALAELAPPQAGAHPPPHPSPHTRVA